MGDALEHVVPRAVGSREGDHAPPERVEVALRRIDPELLRVTVHHARAERARGVVRQVAEVRAPALAVRRAREHEVIRPRRAQHQARPAFDLPRGEQALQLGVDRHVARRLRRVPRGLEREPVVLRSQRPSPEWASGGVEVSPPETGDLADARARVARDRVRDREVFGHVVARRDEPLDLVARPRRDLAATHVLREDALREPLGRVVGDELVEPGAREHRREHRMHVADRLRREAARRDEVPHELGDVARAQFGETHAAERRQDVIAEHRLLALGGPHALAPTQRNPPLGVCRDRLLARARRPREGAACDLVAALIEEPGGLGDRRATVLLHALAVRVAEVDPVRDAPARELPLVDAARKRLRPRSSHLTLG
nr:hypothetical protein [Sandaracinus amylolyticus]